MLIWGTATEGSWGGWVSRSVGGRESCEQARWSISALLVPLGVHVFRLGDRGGK